MNKIMQILADHKVKAEVLKKVKKVLTAYFNNERVEFKTQDPNDPFVSVWLPVDKFEQLALLEKEPYNYRVKVKRKYVPFENAEEFVTALQEHGNFIKQTSTYYFPVNVDNDGIMLTQYYYNSNISFEDLFKSAWKFADGEICGKLINEDDYK